MKQHDVEFNEGYDDRAYKRSYNFYSVGIGMEFDESWNVGSSRRACVEDCAGARLFPCTGNKLGNKITPRPSAATLHALVQYGRVVSPRIVSAAREKSFEGHRAPLRAPSLRVSLRPRWKRTFVAVGEVIAHDPFGKKYSFFTPGYTPIPPPFRNYIASIMSTRSDKRWHNRDDVGLSF
ncbi:hypothetical protein K0M31_013069 [Melipona bicolor]|uniref:Uncharacterized protein n=1 Tax=Melipona bicolor TaxID=60889 RepID=A0AA40KGX7_9HYME|nr:hypothetical protein K0M31_013069 [Melipona bicolor]